MSHPEWSVRSQCLFVDLLILAFAGVVSAPLWNSEKSKFAGMLTVLDIIHLIQYYYDTVSYDSAASDVEHFRLESLKGTPPLLIGPSVTKSLLMVDIEKSLGVATPPLLREHPSSSLWDAGRLLIQTHARRLPLLDNDTETGHEVIVSVLTQYRLLKFISINASNILLTLSIGQTDASILVEQRSSKTTCRPAEIENRHICTNPTSLRQRRCEPKHKPLLAHCNSNVNHARLRRRPYVLRTFNISCANH